MTTTATAPAQGEHTGGVEGRDLTIAKMVSHVWARGSYVRSARMGPPPLLSGGWTGASTTATIAACLQSGLGGAR